MRIRSCTVALMTTCAIATAQYSTDFEGVTASAAGTVLTGQDAYYLPNTTSADFLAYTYAGNPLGVPANPTGGTNFIGGTGPAGGVFARAQRNINDSRGAGVYTASFDICVTFNGAALPTANNAGSLSIQPFPGSQSFIALARWVDVATAANWNADYVYFDAAGLQVTGSVADPNFQNLLVNNWYRWETAFDLNTNAIVAINLTDLATGTTFNNAPVGWYMDGGSAGNNPPNGFRFFGGGSVAGNTLSFDNLDIIPTPAVGDILYYKWQAGCTDKVVNFGDAGLAPNEGTIETSDPAGSSPWGTGIYGGGLAAAPTGSGGFYNRVDSGWDGAFDGSFTAAWWMDGAGLTPPASLSYFFSGVGSFRCFTGGLAGTGLYTRVWGGADLILTTDIQAAAAGGWTHIALVVDGTGLSAEYYVNGVGQGPIVIAVPASVSAGANTFRVGMHTGATSACAYNLDEFHFANRAYSAAEIMALATQHPAAEAPYGFACLASNAIGSVGGAPTIGNANYGIELWGPANGLFYLVAGWNRCNFGGMPLPLDLGIPFPVLTGCELNTSGDFGTISNVLDASGHAVISVPIPPTANMDQTPVFWQALLVDASGVPSITSSWNSVVGN